MKIKNKIRFCLYLLKKMEKFKLTTQKSKLTNLYILFYF